jgi:hypothetical protein
VSNELHFPRTAGITIGVAWRRWFNGVDNRGKVAVRLARRRGEMGRSGDDRGSVQVHLLDLEVVGRHAESSDSGDDDHRQHADSREFA